jgi:hypothetical protein
MSSLTSANRIWDEPTERMAPVPVTPAPSGSGRTADFEPQRPRRVLDAGRLWSGGLATAVVAALVALTGVLIVRVLIPFAPAAHLTAFTDSATVLLCTTAAVAALAATGVAHLLLLSTPRPLEYLGWITGLATAAATVVPFLATSPVNAAVQALLHLVIGLAVATLTGSAAAASRRIATRAAA